VAEAKIHGTTVDHVHFHEVGAVDSIIDTVGTVLGLHLLGVDSIYASELPYSTGYVNCAHGLMPVPAPATLEILKGVPMRPSMIRGELITPTGASILKALSLGFGPPPSFIPESTGYGAGTKEFPGTANVVRLIIGKATPPRQSAQMPQVSKLGIVTPIAMPLAPSRTEGPELGEKADVSVLEESKMASSESAIAGTIEGTIGFDRTTMVKLETNIDDMNPQIIDYVSKKLFEAGAKDVWTQPILMKKGRAAVTLSVLCSAAQESELTKILVTETTTLGVRVFRHERLSVQREMRSFDTGFGEVKVKYGLLNGRVVNAHPEYDDCVRAAQESGLPLKEIFKVVEAAVVASSVNTGAPNQSSELKVLGIKPGQ